MSYMSEKSIEEQAEEYEEMHAYCEDCGEVECQCSGDIFELIQKADRTKV